MSFPTGNLFYWSEALRQTRLRTLVKHTGAAIAAYADKHGACHPGYELLAEDMSCSTRAVELAVPELETAGFLTVVRGTGKGHSNQYQLTLPDTLPKERPSGDVRKEVYAVLKGESPSPITGAEKPKKAPKGERRSPNAREVATKGESPSGFEPEGHSASSKGESGSAKGERRSAKQASKGERNVPLTPQVPNSLQNSPKATPAAPSREGVLQELEKPTFVNDLDWAQVLDLFSRMQDHLSDQDVRMLVRDWPTFRAAPTWCRNVAELMRRRKAAQLVDHLCYRKVDDSHAFAHADNIGAILQARFAPIWEHRNQFGAAPQPGEAEDVLVHVPEAADFLAMLSDSFTAGGVR